MAQKACLSGDVARGVERLADLYVITEDPTYIFNQARCFEQNQRYYEAIGRFREYLVKGRNLSRQDRADTERRISTCKSYLAQPEPAGPEPAPSPKPPADPTPTTPLQSTAPPPSTATSVQPPPVAVIHQAAITKTEDSGSGFRAAGIAITAVGVAGLATGLVLNLKANSMASDLEALYGYDAGTDSSRKTYVTLSAVGYSVGGACLAGGVLLYYLGSRRGQQSSLALVPMATSTSAGAVLRGGF